MSRTQINEAKIGRYGRKLLAYMKEYNQDLNQDLYDKITEELQNSGVSKGRTLSIG